MFLANQKFPRKERPMKQKRDKKIPMMQSCASDRKQSEQEEFFRIVGEKEKKSEGGPLTISVSNLKQGVERASALFRPLRISRFPLCHSQLKRFVLNSRVSFNLRVFSLTLFCSYFPIPSTRHCLLPHSFLFMATETLEDKNPPQEPEAKGKEDIKEGEESKGPEEKGLSEKDAPAGEVGNSQDKNVEEKGPERKEVESESEENTEANLHDEAEAELKAEKDVDDDNTREKDGEQENNTGEKDEEQDDEDHKGETDGEQEDEQVQDDEREQEEDEGDEAEAEAEEKPKAKGRPKGSSKGDQSESKKQRKEKTSKQDSDKKDPVTPASDRPTRERKTVERYSIPSPGKFGRSSAGKNLLIEKGRGTLLKDIPNVAFKLSKRKPDDNLQILHSILFGKRAKAQTLKRNIGQFSGYVWVENEDKHRAKVKEKLDKCVKEKLVDFCDVLNIPISKGSVKKEELSAKLLEFLESPHATTDVLLADKEQKGKKRKSKATPSKVSTEASIETSSKKQKQSSQVGKKRKQSSDVEEEDDKTEPSDEKNDSQDGEDVSAPNNESDEEEDKSDEEEDKPKAQKHPSKKVEDKSSAGKTEDRATPVKKAAAAKSTKGSEKTSKKSTSKKSATEHDNASATPSKSKQSLSKKQKTAKENQDSKGKTVSKKQTDKSSKISNKGQGKSGKKAKAEPSREEMHAVVVDILKEVDFNTATLSDILRQLGTHFGVDLMNRKAEVKDIITEVINNMSDEEEEEADNAGDDEAEKDDDEDA